MIENNIILDMKKKTIYLEPKLIYLLSMKEKNYQNKKKTDQN